MFDPAGLGRSFGPYRVVVSAEQIAALAACLGLPQGTLPPTLPTCFGLWANAALLQELERLGAPLPRLLHGEQGYVYHRPLEPGTVLTATPTIVGLERKHGRNGSFDLLTLETAWRNELGELIFVDTLLVVVRD